MAKWMIDFEGTITDNSWRQHLVKRDKPDWHSYYKGLVNDKPRVNVMLLVVKLMVENHEVMIYTTRMPNKHNLEMRWLNRYSLPGITLARENTKLPGPLLVRQWAELHRPNFLLDDRAENRESVINVVPNVLSPEVICVNERLS